MMKRLLRILATTLTVTAAIFMSAPPASSRSFNDKLLNRPYADNRAWNLGFSVGMFSSDLIFTHNGYVSEDGRQWFMEQPSFSPGFSVNGLLALRLSNHFSVRFTPGMYFGNREVEMRDALSGDTEKQNIKSAFVVLPIELKFAAQRWRNARPYLVGGVMPTFDVAKKRSDDILRFKPFDTYLTIGFGCDFYLPYFKLIPELKFCFGLADILKKDRPELVEEPAKLDFTRSLDKVKSRMIVLTFYFE